MNFSFVFIVAYLIGSIPFGLIIGKVFFKVDIRKQGSGNIGATNSTRALGKKVGLVVFLLDAFKGFLSALLCLWLLPPSLAYLAALGALIGHCYSIFMKFKGGKAISTNFGLILGFNPLIALLGLILFGIILKVSKYVSVSSVLSAVLMLAISLFIQEHWFHLLLSLSTLLITLKHIPNFRRIRSGTEPKVKSSNA